uniref:Thiamine transporter 2 n=1 Tax=Parastrongyloides trichosuri TaxID=131310 RepID=A0A0N4Z210_PARTI
MERWQVITAVLLICYGLLKEFRPTEPYLYDYQIHEQNISDFDLENEIYPWWTYSYMFFLIPVLLLTDILMYKFVLILESISYIGCWLLIIFCNSVTSQVIMEIVYGAASATEIAYFSYIYAYFDEKYYRKITIGSRVSINLGKCVSYFIAQIIIQNSLGSYDTLNYISLGSLILACLSTIFLPNIEWKKLRNDIEKYNKDIFIESYKDYAIFKIKSFGTSVKNLISNQSILVWSLWWILATCGNLQIGNYIQVIWATAKDYSTSGSNYNGLVEAICPILYDGVQPPERNYLNITHSNKKRHTIKRTSQKHPLSNSLMQTNISPKSFVSVTPTGRKRRLVSVNKHDLGPRDVVYQMDDKRSCMSRDKNSKTLSNDSYQLKERTMNRRDFNTSEEMYANIDDTLLRNDKSRKNSLSNLSNNFLSYHNRSCTNVFSLLLLLIFIGGWIFVAHEALKTADPNRIIHPADSNGRLCGVNKPGYYNFSSKPYVLFFDLTKCISWVTFLSGCPTKQVCVEQCPNKYFSYLELQGTNTLLQQQLSDMVCIDESMKQQITSFNILKNYVQMGYCTAYTVKSVPWLGRCIPQIFVNAVNSVDALQASNGSLDRLISNLGNGNGQVPTDFQVANTTAVWSEVKNSQGIIAKVISDITVTWWQIIVFLVAAALISLFYIIVLRIVGGMIIWLTIFIVFIILGGGSGYCWYRYKLLKDAGAIDDFSFQPNINLYFNMPTTWMVIAIGISIIFGIFSLIMLVVRSRIKLALLLIEETSKAVGKITSTVLFPIFPFLLHIGVFCVWATVSLWIASSGVPNCRNVIEGPNTNISNYGNGPSCNCSNVGTDVDPTCKYINVTRNENIVMGMQAYNLFGFFWLTCFISSFHDMILAGAFASYYWAYNKKTDVPTFPLLKSLARTVRYHLGSLAIGSLLIAIVKFIKAILEWLHSKLKGADNIVFRIIFKCLGVFFWLLENFLKFLNKNAFILMSIYGKPFWTSAKDAFSLLARNIIRVVVVNRVTAILLFIGKISITLSLGFLSFQYFSGHWVVEELPKFYLNYYFTPIIIIVVGTYYIADLFFGVYDIGVNTTFMCFLQDCEINDGSINKPYYMSKNLKKILEKKNDEKA